MKCKYCEKLFVGAKCICDQWVKGLLDPICTQCYLQRLVNSKEGKA
jgi:hypothetical protein